MTNFTKFKDVLENHILEEGVLPPAVKTFMDFWSKRLGLTIKVYDVRKGNIKGEYKWVDYKIAAYTKTNIFLGYTTIALQSSKLLKEKEKMFFRYANGETSGVFMGAGWDENNIERAKKDVEKLMKKLYYPPEGMW